MSFLDCAPDCDERADCPDAGQIGHTACGRCSKCGVAIHHHARIEPCRDEPVVHDKEVAK